MLYTNDKYYDQELYNLLDELDLQIYTFLYEIS